MLCTLNMQKLHREENCRHNETYLSTPCFGDKSHSANIELCITTLAGRALAREVFRILIAAIHKNIHDATQNHKYQKH